ncbi:MAG TPA: transposase [Burkholderiaceae bacterium]|jgi:transposase-like protein
MDSLVKAPGRRTRHRYDGEFKKSVIEACRQPGISIAAVALANGLNANILRKWVIDADARREVGAQFEQSLPSTTAAPTAVGFIPLSLPAPPEVPQAIRIELQRGPLTVTMIWPVSAAGECASWMRELLR